MMSTTSMTTLTSSSSTFTETSLAGTSGGHQHHHFSASSLLTNSFDGSFTALTHTPLSTCSNDIDDHHLDDEDEADADEEYDDEDEEDDTDSADAIWRINSKQANYYRAQFTALQPDLQGLVRGKVAKVFFERSGLPVSELSAVWKLSDADRDGALSLPEFSIAMHLVVLRRKGVPLPHTLPSVMQQVYGSLGVPVYHLPSPLVPPPFLKTGSSKGNLFSGRYQVTVPFQKNGGGDSHQEQQASQSEGNSPFRDDISKYTGSNAGERKKQWTVFTESPPLEEAYLSSGDNDHHHHYHQQATSITSIDGLDLPSYPVLEGQQQRQPQPVNFDYNTEFIASNPHIKHPVPLRFSPLLPSPSGSTSVSSATLEGNFGSQNTATTFSAFSRLSMVSGGGGSDRMLSPASINNSCSELHSTTATTSDLLSQLPLSAISAAIPGEWHVVAPLSTSGLELDRRYSSDGSSNCASGVHAGKLNDFMVSPDFGDVGDNDDEDDDDDEVDQVGEIKIVQSNLGNSPSTSKDYSPPYLIPRDGTLDSVLAIQGLEERLIARYMAVLPQVPEVFSPEVTDKSDELYLQREAVAKLEEAIAFANRQNEALLVEMLTLLKLVRKNANKIN